MKNSWRVILTFSPKNLGKQFRNDLMMLRGTSPLAKNKTKQNKNKNNQKQKQKTNKTKQKQNTHTHTHTPPHTQKNMFCALSQN